MGKKSLYWYFTAEELWMTSMYMKRCSTLPVIKEVQNKATTRDTITRVLEWLKKSHQETNKQKKQKQKQIPK